MKIDIKILILAVLIFITIGNADVSVKIIHLEGNVKIRYGLEENWKTASIGVFLKDMDTILSGENSRIILQFDNGNRFTLGSNSLLDISDMRNIYEKELFLYLMSKKVDQIHRQEEKTPLRIGNVSVVHGEAKLDPDSIFEQQSKSNWAEWEINGALSLYNQYYFANTVVKLHKILEKYDSYEDCGKVFLYIARSLEQLKMDGQAIDAYKSVIDSALKQKCDDEESQARIEECQVAIDNLKK